MTSRNSAPSGQRFQAHSLAIWGLAVSATFALSGAATNATAQDAASAASYATAVEEDQPIAWWRMSAVIDGVVANNATTLDDPTLLDARRVGQLEANVAGPVGEEFPDFEADNLALRFSRGKNFLRVTDPGESSPIDFDNGDAITIEAWVQPDGKPSVTYSYIAGKGRTLNAGVGDRNQNYSFRLANSGGSARLSFFFVDSETKPGNQGRSADGHRWTSKQSVSLDRRWHHVAMTYVFGEPESIRGYIDGEETKGVWDLAGPTSKRPIVDDDELWIGSSMAGRATFPGVLDEVAIYRTALTPEDIAQHVNIHRRNEILAVVQAAASSAPSDHVQYDVFTEIPDSRNWDFLPAGRRGAYQSDVFALTELPRDYDDRAVIVDWPTPMMVHAYAQVRLPAGEYQLAFRALNSARLYIDEKLVTETPFLNPSSNGHGAVYELQPSPPDRVSLPAAHTERLIDFTSDGKPHRFSVLALAGLKGRPAELGELVLAYAPKGEPFRFMVAGNQPSSDSLAFDDEGWTAFLDRDLKHRRQWEADTRLSRGEAEVAYWQKRHAWARDQYASNQQPSVPEVEHSQRVNNAIDSFIEDRLGGESDVPTPLVDDWEFIRRVSLDVIGVIPTPEAIEQFFADPAPLRRAAVIDRLLDDPGWADHWVGYWQDVLAENPGLTKPTLNNSGPFRWYLHEAFLDNKPFDRIVTELLTMEGGRKSGGPGGFAVATNNDVPMAHKAHIVGTALLGIEMKCARCHDAPTHESTQRDLFELAAMLQRKPVAVPKSSTVPATPEQLAHMAIKVSLEPGVPVDPAWPFEQLNTETLEDIPAELKRNQDDSRSRLAWYVTHPENERFAQVIVNRMWERYLGRGLFQTTHDWEGSDPSNPELLNYLASELVLYGYDLKHIARLILNSQAYQRQIDRSDDHATREAQFASPTRRRMTAEQLTDSVFQAVGKPFDTEELCVNPDGRQSAGSFSNLGTPRRAWEFACPSNERERPSMTLPRAQSVVDMLMAYGWRQNRQEPVNHREESVTPLAPLVLAHGVATNRAIDLADHGALVELCLAEQSVEELVTQLWLRFYSRTPSAEEKLRYVGLLSEGYQERRTGEPRMKRTVDRSPLAWSNNLDAKANQIGEARQRKALEGDAPTRRLTEDWRQRVEDTLWVMVNSPEFIFVP